MKNYTTPFIRKKMTNEEEETFLQLVHKILQSPIRPSRTGVDIHSTFGTTLLFSLSRFPLLTTRKIQLRLVFEELMWFIRGQTDVRILQQKNVHVWDDNSTREFLDKVGLTNTPTHTIGKSYGYQMRSFGGDSIHGDQLRNVIDQLIHEPTSRRMLINLWNPSELQEMALPPCLYGYQFYVDWEQDGTKKLSVVLTQRSSDIALAGGWNIATGALLVYLLCHVLGMKPGLLRWNVGDAHVYQNQVDAVEKQLQRIPHEFPTLRIRKEIPTELTTDSVLDAICSMEWSDVVLENYHPHGRIQIAMNP
jgi:thymidylate synthase